MTISIPLYIVPTRISSTYVKRTSVLIDLHQCGCSYNADMYNIETSLSLSGVPECESFDFQKELRDSIASTVGYNSGMVSRRV